MIKSFPLFLSLHGRSALVVGGGEPAARKVELLLSAGAQVSLIAPTVTGEIAQLIVFRGHDGERHAGELGLVESAACPGDSAIGNELGDLARHGLGN